MKNDKAKISPEESILVEHSTKLATIIDLMLKYVGLSSLVIRSRACIRKYHIQSGMLKARRVLKTHLPLKVKLSCKETQSRKMRSQNYTHVS